MGVETVTNKYLEQQPWIIFAIQGQILVLSYGVLGRYYGAA